MKGVMKKETDQEREKTVMEGYSDKPHYNHCDVNPGKKKVQ